MAKIEVNNLLTVTQAATLRGTTPAAVSKLMRQKKLETVEIAGRKFVTRESIESFVPIKIGRPSITARETNG
jgi:predicted transcriptional regulator